MQCFSNKTIWILHMVTKNQKAKTTGKSSTNKKKKHASLYDCLVVY